jgi:hypothetical protein
MCDKKWWSASTVDAMNIENHSDRFGGERISRLYHTYLQRAGEESFIVCIF